MTGYTVYTGSSEKFSEGWDKIFGQGKPRQKKPAAPKSAGAQSDTSDTEASKAASTARKRKKSGK